MEMLTKFIAPVISLWVIHNAIFSSAGFVNRMRETVVAGRYDGEKIEEEHRRAILIDWVLCVAATIAVCLIFAIAVIAVSLGLAQSSLLQWTGFAIALYPLLCAVGFALCSVGDFRLMVRAIDGTGLTQPRWWRWCVGLAKRRPSPAVPGTGGRIGDGP